MSTRTTLNTELFGRDVEFGYSEKWVGYSLFILRVVMGWTLFQGGVTKLVTYLDADPSNNWTAAGFLANAIPPGNPFTDVFVGMAGSPLIDMLNMWGLTLTGLALILGAFVRWSAFWGAVMMVFYWAASLPLAHAILIDDHIVYAALLFGLGAFGAGRILGLDAYLEDTGIVRNTPVLRLALG